ncbi:SDR family NAD(P)-dependent oxidoreductase [Undibacterium pigrum]|uniref:NAD(P)-dependent dehydrogenase (Short-subunit alcohol dehydrogenase family) n=1 Tax=Undibacterium pigrum TaxID=401470 RepID=A0A318J7C2_9BURK|nr:SDR family NAD(P)-dependent oxidoreductase [Undibacterium pigrum]PXX42560.1 NAD(P)-dependent dehydrogenase (short-subunit alcohol dehydrogenase family) [Undibacterium pigrum]
MPDTLLPSFPQNFRALIIGASGGIGAAFVDLLREQNNCAIIECLHRQSQPALDFVNEASIAEAASAMKQRGPFHLIINATGVLHTADFMPEKKLADLQYEQMQATFLVNTFGPAMLLRHFTPLLDKQRGVMAMLSAKVGSIEDNRLGGWYSYRASKAALNMMIRTAAIELKRTHPNAVLFALHPGTVNTALSQPFRGASIGRPVSQAASEMLAVIDSMQPAQSGEFYTYAGETLPW